MPFKRVFLPYIMHNISNISNIFKFKYWTDYFIKCHSGKNELYVQVGNGSTDHGAWVPPEYMQYSYPSYKINASKPGSDVAAETAAALAAASLLFKETDSSYAQTCLKHAIELYDFADEYREKVIIFL